jgi:hypothetical protein
MVSPGYNVGWDSEPGNPVRLVKIGILTHGPHLPEVAFYKWLPSLEQDDRE